MGAWLGRQIYAELEKLGFLRFGTIVGNELRVERELAPEPAVYVATLDDQVFWVGETGNARSRFGSYRHWLALPDNSPRRDLNARNRLVEMAGDKPLILFLKKPFTVWSDLTKRNYPAHRLEEAILIDYFQPAWNMRAGGRRKG